MNEVAERASGLDPVAISMSVNTARIRFIRVQRVQEHEARWNARHPIYATMIDLPLLGSRLRERRRRYVERKLDAAE